MKYKSFEIKIPKIDMLSLVREYPGQTALFVSGAVIMLGFYIGLRYSLQDKYVAAVQRIGNTKNTYEVVHGAIKFDDSYNTLYPDSVFMSDLDELYSQGDGTFVCFLDDYAIGQSILCNGNKGVVDAFMTDSY